MDGIVLFIISMVILLVSAIITIIKSSLPKKRNDILKLVNYLMIGTFIASLLLFIPVCMSYFGQDVNIFKTLVYSLYNSMCLFVVNADFEFVKAFTDSLDLIYGSVYEGVFLALFIFAPILTFSFVISLFNNLSSYLKLCLRGFTDWYIFSEINERSIALASDIRKNNKKATIIFTDIHFAKDETNELIEQTNEFSAIIFKKSINAISCRLHSAKKKLVFFAISESEKENISNSATLVERYKDKQNSWLYLFSSTKQSELFLDGIPTNHSIKIRRIKEESSLVNRFLYDYGIELPKGAHCEEDGLKVISAVVVGMGKYGMEISKALPWFCQLPGFRFKMNVFDKDEKIESKFKALCPEYLNPANNKVYVEGEAQYDITVHGNMRYDAYEYGEELQKIKDASFVFIALGSDEHNVNCAINTRMYFERIGVHPKIVAVVHDGDIIQRIKNAVATDGRSYDINYIGNFDTLYSVESVINSDLEVKALKVHMSYPPQGKTIEEHEQSFWSNEYNYNSSCASAIHNKLRVELKISGVEKEEKDQTKEERDIISIIEHRRWNAYVRSCGYVYSGSKEKSSRNDLAKKHNCLVPFDKLTDDYKKIDTDIGLKK